MRRDHTPRRAAPGRRRTTAKPGVTALAVAALVTGCSQVLGFKDPRLDDTGNPAIDAAAASLDTAPGGCSPSACPFGCNSTTNACLDSKLWVYMTTGSFLGDGFGGKDTPPLVRATSDALCFATASAKHRMRQCAQGRTHAVLSVSTADSLPFMATKYTIPITVPVHRADDDVLVANSWNDLIDITKQPRAPVSTAATEPAGIVWSGATESSTCKNWTSEATADSGVQGHTTLTSANWLARGAGQCDLLARLLCICWSGGN
jgi:hypothetical protein